MTIDTEAQFTAKYRARHEELRFARRWAGFVHESWFWLAFRMLLVISGASTVLLGR
jgi:hypothetical protein